MDSSMSAALMADFKAGSICYLPRTWCRACGDATKSARRPSACEHHEVKTCTKCKTRITTAHVDLDYVGHADVRARLCEADPEWTWVPYADIPGGALIERDGWPVGLWILLTIGGVTKPGYGTCEKGKAEAIKELIGDALRNAALSFGVAWKLWAKGDRSDQEGQRQASHGEGAPPQRTRAKVTGAEHERLRHGTVEPTPDDRPAQRARAGNGTVVDDLWAGQPAGEFKAQETSLPDRRAKPHTPAQMIAAHWRRLGITDDEERHNWTARMAGVDELASTTDLPPDRQRTILTVLAQCKDIGKVQEWIDEQTGVPS